MDDKQGNDHGSSSPGGARMPILIALLAVHAGIFVLLANDNLGLAVAFMYAPFLVLTLYAGLRNLTVNRRSS
jgi:hypothetical protein